MFKFLHIEWVFYPVHVTVHWPPCHHPLSSRHWLSMTACLSARSFHQTMTAVTLTVQSSEDQSHAVDRCHTTKATHRRCLYAGSTQVQTDLHQNSAKCPRQTRFQLIPGKVFVQPANADGDRQRRYCTTVDMMLTMSGEQRRRNGGLSPMMDSWSASSSSVSDEWRHCVWPSVTATVTQTTTQTTLWGNATLSLTSSLTILLQHNVRRRAGLGLTSVQQRLILTSKQDTRRYTFPSSLHSLQCQTVDSSWQDRGQRESPVVQSLERLPTPRTTWDFGAK